MFRLRRKTRSEKVTEALKDAASYTDRLVHDRRLRADLRSAIDHGARATTLVRRDVRTPRSASRLAGNARLRKTLRAAVDDLDRAAGRIKRKRKTHRVRNVLIIVGGTGAAVAGATQGRRLLHRPGTGRELASPL